MDNFIRFEHVGKIYKSGDVEIEALRDVSFTIGKGEICVIVGASGAGKTTLLNILGGMDSLSSGKAFLEGQEISAYGARALAQYRRSAIGFVFQFYNLIPNLTALENVEIASQLTADPLPAAEVLAQVGLGQRLHNFPAQRRKLRLCDEPTGALDDTTGKSILRLLQDQSRTGDMTVVIITHNAALTAMADRVIRIQSGTIVSNQQNEQPVPVDQIEW